MRSRTCTTRARPSSFCTGPYRKSIFRVKFIDIFRVFRVNLSIHRVNLYIHAHSAQEVSLASRGRLRERFLAQKNPLQGSSTVIVTSDSLALLHGDDLPLVISPGCLVTSTEVASDCGTATAAWYW